MCSEFISLRSMSSGSFRRARFDQSSLDIRQTNIAAVSNYGPISAEVGYTYNAEAFIT